MRNILPLSLVMGAVAGLAVGGFLNVFNAPVMEWAIELEGLAAGETSAAAASEPAGFYDFLGSLGMQRIGLVFGLAVLGVIYGAVFTGLFHLVRQAAPGWNVWAWAIIAGVLGFWAVSLFTQLKFPLNPPGIGEDASLISRQAFQMLFILLSVSAVVAAAVAVRFIHQSRPEGSSPLWGYIGIVAGYGIVAVVIFNLIPGNPDPIPEWVPESLVIMFRTFSIIGHLLLWLITAVGVSGYIRYREKGIRATAAPAAEREAPASNLR